MHVVSYHTLVFLFASLTAVHSFQCQSQRFGAKNFFPLKNAKDSDDPMVEEPTKSIRVCIIGSGWAGFSAADAMSTCKGLEIHMLDASPRGPGGLAAGWTSRRLNRTVEAGLHGFWREYKNTFAAMERVGLDIDDVLTDYTPSVLVSESGRVAYAPVLGEESNSDSTATTLSSNTGLGGLLPTVVANLPPPLDIALLSEYNPKNPLSLADRISAIGLLGVWSDFDQEDEQSWSRYDRISADTLFRSVGGVSTTTYRELVSPLLHVLPMTPGYDCSAAAALSCFHTFALQSRGAFDVRWCKGSISDRIFNPWATKLQSTGQVTIEGGSKVTSIKEMNVNGNKLFEVEINGEKRLEYDYIVFAVGANSFKRLLPACSFLSKHPMADTWQNLRGVTCVAVRLFLKPQISEHGKIEGIPAIDEAMKDSPVFVCGPNVGGIPELVETGFCVYDLQRLQDEYSRETQREQKESTPCVAYEIDFFRANVLADMGDDEVATVAVKALCAALEISDIGKESILDVSVVRARDAVSHFCLGSASSSPSVKLHENVFICGDWIDRTGHGSWSTEKAVVTGIQAASSLAKDMGLDCDTKVIPTAPETRQLSALRQIAKTWRKTNPIAGFPSAPWT